MKPFTRRPIINKVTHVYVFRVYYDPDTGICISKSDGLDHNNLPSIEVDQDTYNSIDVCEHFRVDNGILGRVKRVPKFKKIILQSGGKFKTLKNNMIFAVSDNYTGEVDEWDYYNG